MAGQLKRYATGLYNAVLDHHVLNGAAALAFFLMLAIFPAAIFLLSLLPYLPVPHLYQSIMELLNQALPREAATLFTGVVDNVMSTRRGGLVSFGFLFALWSASSGLSATMEQLNISYGIRETRPFWKARGTALMLVFLFVVLIVGAFGLVVFGGVIQDLIASFLGRSEALLFFFVMFRWVVIVLFILSGFAVIYYFGPDRDQKFRLISPGTVTGSLILILASLGFNVYVSNFANYTATYGSLGAVIILLLWFYIVGLVLLIGMEIDCLVEKRREEEREGGSGEAAQEAAGRGGRAQGAWRG